MQNYLLTNEQIELLYIPSILFGCPIYGFRKIHISELEVGDIFRIRLDCEENKIGVYLYDKLGKSEFKCTAPPTQENEYWRICIE